MIPLVLDGSIYEVYQLPSHLAYPCPDQQLNSINRQRREPRVGIDANPALRWLR